MNDPKGGRQLSDRQAVLIGIPVILVITFLLWAALDGGDKFWANPAALADLSKTEFERRRGHVKLLETWHRSELVPRIESSRGGRRWDREELPGPLLLFYDDATGEPWSLFCMLKPGPDGYSTGVGACSELMADIRRRGLVREAVPVELEIGKFHYGWRSMLVSLLVPGVSVSGVSIDRRIAGSYVIGGK